MDNTDTKVCPLCCERINMKARKCPRCQHYQNKWTLLAYHPMVAVLPMFLALMLSGYFLTRVLGPGVCFDSYRSQIHVIESSMQFGDRQSGQSSSPTVAVVGKIKNDSGVVWKNAVIEVAFFDKDHKLIDAKQQDSYGEVLALDEPCAFKVSMPREFSADKYASYEVRVVAARDNRRFLP